MLLIGLTVLAAFGVALATRGRLRDFPSVRLRWLVLAVVGLLLQFLPIGGELGTDLLLVSFAILIVFALGNRTAPGFILILVGLSLNALVISANAGMPVTRHALEASHQQGTLTFLVDDSGAKHHLARPSDVLLPLADTIPIGGGIDQIVSPGDIATYLGLIWLIVACMRPRREADPLPGREEAVRVGV